MKSPWRILRMVQAAMLISLAALVFYFWPVQPRWSVKGPTALAFDLQRQLLFTEKYHPLEQGEHFELHGYDLNNGQLTWRQTVELSGNKASHDQWNAIMSADCSKLACWNTADLSIVVHDVHQQCRKLMQCKAGSAIDSLCLSQDGSLLAFRSFEVIEIWDTATGILKQTMAMPPEMIVHIRSGDRPTYPECIQFSGDKRYLAVRGDGPFIMVYDWQAAKAIGECPVSHSPHFLSDNKTLLTPPLHYSHGDMKFYQVEGEQLKPHPLLPRYGLPSTNFLAFSNVHILSNQLMTPQEPYPKWMPQIMQDKLEWLLQLKLDRATLQVRDTSSGELRNEFSLPNANLANVKLSPDGLRFAANNDDLLFLWDIPPQRSYWCWVVCFCISLLALYVGYPRRTKGKLR